jgi:hypothetical protein
MAGELQVPYDRTARTVYVIVRDATGRPMRTDTLVAEAYVTANRASKYAIAAVEQGTASKHYVGTMPAFPVGVYELSAYDCAAGAPVTSNAVEGDSLVAVDPDFEWSGAVKVSVLMTVPVDPDTTLPTWGDTFDKWFAYLIAKTINKTLTTTSSETTRNTADTGDLATRSVTDDGTTFTKGVET